jgi:Membrane bound beta barrel domain (DUF5777)
MRSLLRLTCPGLLLVALCAPARSQETTPAPAPSPTPAPSSPQEPLKEPVAFRPIEANVIINLPSVQVPSEKTLTFLVTHRFTTPLSQGDINNFFTLDNGNTWGFGLWYAPITNLNAGIYRSSDLATYEASAQYELPSLGGFASSLRVGEDWRTEPGVSSPKSSFFAQVVLAYSFGNYVRVTAVPTYVQRTSGFPSFVQSPLPNDQSCQPLPDSPNLYRCSGHYESVFNVPVAASIAVTHSIAVHGEVVPRLSKANSTGVGWSVSVEKALLRHRFAFFAGNQRQTTVDEYIQAVPFGRSPSNVYIGFNLFRAWNFR